MQNILKIGSRKRIKTKLWKEATVGYEISRSIF